MDRMMWAENFPSFSSHVKRLVWVRFYDDQELRLGYNVMYLLQQLSTTFNCQGTQNSWGKFINVLPATRPTYLYTSIEQRFILRSTIASRFDRIEYWTLFPGPEMFGKAELRWMVKTQVRLKLAWMGKVTEMLDKARVRWKVKD